MFDRIYTIIDQHLCHQICKSRFMIKYIFVIYLFGFTSIDLFLHKLGQTLRQFDPPTKLEVHSSKDEGSINEHFFAYFACMKLLPPSRCVRLSNVGMSCIVITYSDSYNKVSYKVGYQSIFLLLSISFFVVFIAFANE